MSDGPYRTDGFPLNVKRGEETLFDEGGHGTKIAVTQLDAFHHEGNVAVEHVAAGAKIARGAATDVGFPNAGDRRPVEAFFIPGQEADAGGAGLENIEDGVCQRLKDGLRRIGEGLGESDKGTVFGFIIRGPGGATIQFVVAEN
jgi:hypothetical protein